MLACRSGWIGQCNFTLKATIYPGYLAGDTIAGSALMMLSQLKVLFGRRYDLLNVMLFDRSYGRTISLIVNQAFSKSFDVGIEVSVCPANILLHCDHPTAALFVETGR
jgi:hypothetical protein